MLIIVVAKGSLISVLIVILFNPIVVNAFGSPVLAPHLRKLDKKIERAFILGLVGGCDMCDIGVSSFGVRNKFIFKFTI